MEPTDCKWRDVSPDYYGRLQQFECAKGMKEFSRGATRKHAMYYNEWELEVQSTIRGFRKCSNPESQWAHICVKPGMRDELDTIYSFVWFGIVNGTKRDADGNYIIGYIARSLDAATCKFGDFTLKHALRILKEDQKRTNRDAAVGARIDPRNQPSMNLFKRNGFTDEGEDDNALPYHRWYRPDLENI